MTVPATGAVDPGQLVAIMGTSTCHVVSSEVLTEVPGICGVVHGGIIEGLWGYEAGQSGVGDIFAWFTERNTPPAYVDEARARGISVHDLLTEKAALQPVGGHGLVALDWHSGNRSVLVDHELSGLVVGLTLATRPEDIYRALLEATAFGTRTIIDALRAGRVPVTELVVAGGLVKNRFLMQLYSDVTRLPISIVGSTHAPAVGSAIHAAVAAGAYPSMHGAAAVMGQRDDKLVVEYEERYDVAPELRRGGGRHDSLRYGARIEVGLRQFLEAGGFDAFTTNFEDLGGLRQLPGLAVQRLMADGYGFGGEGDWKTAALLRILKVVAADQPGGTSFMEDYTYHWGPGEPKILGAHMLEVCPSIAGGRPSLQIHPLSIGNREDPVRLVFTAAPGPGLVVGLADLGGRLRLTANEIDLVPPDEPLPRLPVARAVWKPRPSLATSAESWLLAGGPHHTVLSTAVGREALADFADMAGVELLMIDAATDPRSFADRIRWNNAYYRLAQRL